MEASRKSIVARIEHWWPEFIIKHWWKWLLFSLVLMLTLGSGGRHLIFDTNYRIFFSDTNPDLEALNHFENTFTQPDNILIVIKPPSGNAFDKKTLQLVERLTKEAWSIPNAIRVDSISNFQDTHANGDDLIVVDLVENADEISDEGMAIKRERALEEPLLRGSLVAENAGATGINVTIQYPMKSMDEVPQTVHYARDIVSAAKADYPEYGIALSGLIMLNNAFAETGESDMQTLVPFMYLMLIVATIIILRSVVASLLTLVVIAFSTISAMGAAGHMGIPLSPISASAPTIILTLAIADSLHILITILNDMRRGTGKIEAIRHGLRVNLLPVTITSVTTVVGFLTLNFAESPVFWHLGNITAVGILAGWIFSLTLLPALLVVVPLKVKQREEHEDKVGLLLANIAEKMATNKGKVILTVTVLVVALLSMTPSMKLDDNFVKYFDYDIEFRRDAEFTMDNLTGVIRVEFNIDAGETNGVSSPEYLKILDEFTGWLRTHEYVRHVYSFSDIMKRINMNLNEDRKENYVIPDDKEEAAQYLLLYELSLPYGLSLNDRLSIDKSSSRVTATMKDISMVDVRSFIRDADTWLGTHLPKNEHGNAAGVAVMFSQISKKNIEGMLVGNTYGLLVISGLLLLMLKSIRMGAISLVTNIAPIAMSFGVWALIVGEIGMAASTVAAVSLGIIVDDTVHFLTKYIRSRRTGMSSRESIRATAMTVGKAVLIITLIIISGFVVLSASSFRVNVQMGALTAITLSIGSMFNLYVLPALLALGQNDRRV